MMHSLMKFLVKVSMPQIEDLNSNVFKFIWNVKKQSRRDQSKYPRAVTKIDSTNFEIQMTVFLRFIT